MKRTYKVLISLLLVTLISLFSASAIYAETIFTADGFSYTLLDNSYVSIYDWEGGSDDLVIPNTLDWNYVREIRNRCFLGRDDFSKLDLSNANYLYRIGSSAFKNTTFTGELEIPPQVRVVASGAFENCDGIEVLYYNSMSEVISSQCFYDCDALSEVYIADGVNTIESHAFSSCDSLCLVRIPETVTSIASTSFNNCPNLVIYCYYGSYAHHFAEDNGIAYEILDPENIPTEPPTEPEPEGYLLGDTDDNDDVEVVDATWLQRYIALMNIGVIEDTIMQGDVDGDGDPSIVDAAFIMRYCVGIDTPFDIGELVV